MYIFKDGKFVSRPDLAAIVDKALEDKKGNANAALYTLGFVKAADYCHSDDTETMSIGAYVNCEEIAPLAEYDFFINWMAAGRLYFVAITGAPDYYDFLAKHLPVIKLGGELSFVEDD